MLQLLADYTTNYTYTTTTSSSGLGAGFWIGYFIFIIIMYLVSGFILSRIFKKAGRSPGAAFIPFYNSWVLLELGGQSGAHVLWNFLPFVGPIIFLVFYIMAMLEMGRRFGKSATFSVVGLVLFSLIGFIILAFDDSRYNGATPVAAAGYTPPMPGGPVAPGAAPYAATPQPVITPAAPAPDTVPQQPPVAYAPQPSVVPPAEVQPSQDEQPPQPPQPPVGPVSG